MMVTCGLGCIMLMIVLGVLGGIVGARIEKKGDGGKKSGKGAEE